MANVDELILSADSSGLRDAADDYDDLADSAERTESGVNRSSQGMEQSIGSMARGAAKSLALMAASYISVQGALASLTQARGFDAALAETSTLIEGTIPQMAMLEEAAKSLADEYGTDATQQVQAFYQAISGGATLGAGATELLDQANKLAIGGITDVTTSVGILNAALGAYGRDVLTAAEVSDTLFIGMKGGVTTIEQLSSSIGTALPFASQLGVTFDEVVGSVSALTTVGISTSEAVTGVRAALLGILKPTKEASDLAADLGIDFASIKDVGLVAFLEDVTEKTGGSDEAMAKLFGSSEALGAVLALTGGAADKFSDIMGDMADSTGATDEAVNKIDASLSDRFDDSLQRLNNLTLEFGQALLTVAVPALEATVGAAQFLAENMDLLLPPIIAVSAAVAMPLAISGATALAGLAVAAGGAAVSFAGAAASIFAATSATSALSVAAGLLLTPLTGIIAVTAAASAAFYLLRDSTDETEVAAGAAKDALAALDMALTDVAKSGDAASSSSKQLTIDYYNEAQMILEATAQTAALTLERYRASQQTMNPLDGPGNDELREARDNLIAARAATEALRARMEEFGVTTNEAGEAIDENTGRIIKTTEEIQRQHAAQLQFMADDRARAAEASAEAAEILNEYREQAELQQLIAQYGADSAQVAELRADRERAVVAEQLQGLDVAESVKAEILSAVDATHQSEAATQAWANRMAGVAAQLNAIGSALSQMGASAINTAANHAEIAALEAGATVQEAAHSRTLEQINAETEARAMGAANIAEEFLIRQEGAQKTAEVESQAALVAARAAANARASASADTGGGGGGGGSSKAANASLKERTDLMKEAEAIMNSLMDPQDEYNDAIDQANRLLDAGVLPMEAYVEHVANLKDELFNAEWGEVIEGIESVSGSMIDAAFAADSYGDILGDMAQAGVDALADLAAQMLKTYIQQQLLNAISGGAGAGGAGGGLIGAATSLFGGARANGGPVEAGKAYRINENTANSEIFVPSQSGAILNTAQSQNALQMSQPNITVMPADVKTISDAREIDAYRRTPEGERNRQRADRRMSNA